MTQLSPTQAAKRAQIVRGARAAFMAGGYGATSTNRLAEAAGVSKQTLYVYFRSKRELLAAVLEELQQDLSLDRIAIGPTDGEDPADPAWVERAAGAVATAFLGLTMQPDYIDLVRVLIAESRADPALAEQFHQHLPAQVFAIVDQLLAQVVAAGLLPADAVPGPGPAARGLVGPLLTYPVVDGLLRPRARPEPPAAEDVALLVRRWMRGLGIG